jgi:ketosteroid isomerase-like protein
MKVLFPLLMALSLAAFAGVMTSSDEKAVLAAEKQYADGMVKSDPASVAKLLADDVDYFHSNGLRETKADVLKGITGRVKYTAITFETTHVRQYGNTVITNHNVMFTTPTVSHHVYLTTVWVKQAGAWQMVQRQATQLP